MEKSISQLSIMAAPIKKTVELFYDVVSPYTWCAFEVLCRYKKKWNIDVQLKPFFLGGIMKGSDNRPPAMIPNKGQYLHNELPLIAKYFELPIVAPKEVSEVMFVKGSLSAQRYITAVDLMDSSKSEAVAREIWMRIWSRDEDIVEPESLAQASQKAGLSDEEIKSCLEAMKEQHVKDRLKQYTSEALDYGAFGSPTIIVHVDTGKPVMLFGSDRFPILAQLLDEKWNGPNPTSKL